MPRWLDSLFEVLVDTYTSWRDDRTIRLGAGLAYYALFTIVPLLSLTAALASELFGQSDVESFLTERLQGLGVANSGELGEAIADTLDGLTVGSSLGLFGFGSLLFASSLVFLALDDAVNVIWHVPYRVGFRNKLKRRLTSFVMVLVAGGVMVAEFAVSAVTGAAEALVPGEIALLEELAQLLNGMASGVALTAALAFLMRYLAPENGVPWRVAAISSVVTAVVLVLATSVTGWYLRTYGGGSVSGAFGSLLVALTWVYVMAQILLAGVQLSKVVTDRLATG